MLVVFMLRHSLSMVAMKDLLFLVNTLFGKPVVPSTVHILEKPLQFCKRFDVTYYSFLCSVELNVADRSNAGRCSICCKSCNLNDREHVAMYLTASLKSQLQAILEGFTDFALLTERYNHQPGLLSDICDGKLYRKLQRFQFPWKSS